MTIFYVFLLVIVFYSFLKSFYFVYLFQIKEYRLDRFFSLVKEEGIFHVFYFRMIRLPAKTLRNFLIGLISAILSLCLFFFLEKIISIFTPLLIIFIPFIAFFLSLTGVLITSIPVNYYRKRLISLAKKEAVASKAVFIGVTGSFGKTSVKDYLYLILSQKFNVTKTDANMNTEVGLALSILKNLSKNTDYFIAEMGAYKLNEIKNAASIVSPRYGIITGIGNQHLDLFGSKENLINAKRELLLALPTNGTAYVNFNCNLCINLTKGLKCKVVGCSINRPTDIYARGIYVKNGRTFAEVIYKKTVYKLETGLLGHHNIANLLPCIALAADLKIDRKEIVETVKKIKPTPHRLSLHPGPNQSTILSDAYNSNVNGFIAAINTGSLFHHKKKYIISRGVIELGQEKDQSYEKIVNELKKNSFILLTTDRLFKKYDKQDRVLYFDNENKMIRCLLLTADKNSLIVVEGKFTYETMELLTINPI